MQKLKTNENKSMKEYRFCHGTDIVKIKIFY